MQGFASFSLTHDQTIALIDVLQKGVYGGEVTFTSQGDGSLVVAFDLTTAEITTAGTVFED